MTVRLRHYVPALERAIAVIEELAEKGRSELLVPKHRDALGLAVDIENIVYQFDRYLRVIVNANGKTQTVGRPDYRETDNVLDIWCTDSDFSASKEKFYDHCTIEDCEEGKKITVSGFDTLQTKYRNAIRNPLARFFSKEGMELPNADAKIGIGMKFHSMGKFIIGTQYQDFEPTCSSSGGGHYYPVSCKREHKISPKAFKFIADPLFWDSWSQYVAQTFAILAGENTVESVASRFGQDMYRIEEYVEKSKIICYLAIDSSVSKRPFGDMFVQAQCPHRYRGFFASKPLKTLRFMANPDTLNDPKRRAYAERLVERYNIEYAKPNGRPEITVEQLCNTPLRRSSYA